MGEVNYSTVIQDMTWSYSRIKSYYDCNYQWYLKYIRRLAGEDMFFSSYGKYMHELIEKYLKGNSTKQQIINDYLVNFRNKVVGEAPNSKVFTNYFTSGLSYLKTIEKPDYNVLAVEKKVEFDVDKVPFIGYIDIVGEHNGELYIIDNKSKTLKSRSKKGKQTKTDDELDAYLIQLYLYSAAVEQEYGKKPSFLCFNCFRVPIFIQEPFQEEAYEASKRWLLDKVSEITEETDFRPNLEYFKCRHICDVKEHCEYYKLSQGR